MTRGWLGRNERNTRERKTRERGMICRFRQLFITLCSDYHGCSRNATEKTNEGKYINCENCNKDGWERIAKKLKDSQRGCLLEAAG